MRDFFSRLLKSMTPQIIAQLVKAGLIRLGLSISGFQGWIIMIFVKYFVKSIGKAAGETSDAIRDNKNEEEYKKVINNENATVDDKIKSELDLLNGR